MKSPSYSEDDRASDNVQAWTEKIESQHEPAQPISDEQRKEEARILRKVDFRLIPILGALYSVAGLDRVNLSNARVAGMNTDLRFDIGNRYTIALLVFFITYFLFEMPTTLVLRPIGPKLLLPSLAIAWGAVMVGMGFVNDWRIIVVCRMLIGIFEAGFLPCCESPAVVYTHSDAQISSTCDTNRTVKGMYLLSAWYTRYEVQSRMAFWYLINLFVSAFGNILAYAIIKLDGDHGIEGWRWIFIVEGAATLGIALLGYWLVIGFPDQLLASGKYGGFKQHELEVILNRIERDRGDAKPDKLTFEKVVKHAADWKLWVYGFMFLCCSAPIYAFAYFIQIILGTMFDSTSTVFLMCAPPYLASIPWTCGIAWLADRSRKRMPWMALNSALTFVGLLLTAYCDVQGVRYFGVFLGVCGCNGNLPTIIAFQANNVVTDSRRSVANAVQLLFAALGGIYASCTFMQKEYPTYTTGVWCAVATQFLLLILCAIMTVTFRAENKKADETDYAIQDEPSFRYTF